MAAVPVLAIIAALLLPSLGVFLQQGISRDFWISVVLTLLGWVPGVLFALFTILRPKFRTAGARAICRRVGTG